MGENNFICQYCNKECKNLNSLKQHECRCSENPNRIINIEYKNKLSKTKKIISAIKKQNGYKYPNQIEKENKIKEYNKNPKLCLECGKPLTYKQFKYKQNFCCHKCSNQNKETRPPRSNESKEKVRNSVKNAYLNSKSYKKHIQFIEDYYKNPNKCKICNNIIPYEKRNNHVCSEKCLHISCVRSGQKAASVNIKRSLDEIKLYNLCKKHFNVSHNISIANGWDADILLNDYKIAVLWNGPWHYKEMNIRGHSLKQVINRDILKIIEFEKIGWDVLIYQDNQFTPETALVDILLKTKSWFLRWDSNPHSTWLIRPALTN